MYLVHSYYVPLIHETVCETNCRWKVLASTALQKKSNFYEVQFHPEKSSKAGSQLLSNFIAPPMRIIPAIDIINGKCAFIQRRLFDAKDL